MDVIEYFIKIGFRFVRIGFRFVRIGFMFVRIGFRFLGFLFISKIIRKLFV